MSFELPNRNQWRQFFAVLSLKEKIIFLSFFGLFLASVSFFAINFYFDNTEIVASQGGKYIEGITGQPRFLNPIYAPAYDVDRDLTEILFAGLMKYGPDGKIIPDLAERYEVLDGGKIYEFYLKRNAFWSDGKPISANDIVFTVKTIQSPDYKSPLRASWLDVEVEKIAAKEGVRFKLKNPSPIFLENTTLKILPEHIWQEISPQNFPLSIYNLKPVSSGPYRLKDLSQDKDGRIASLDLVRNQQYFSEAPKIKQISFIFRDSEEQLIEDYKKEEIQGFSLANLTDISAFSDSANVYNLSLPRYFAVFFNQEKQKILSDIKIRQALNYGTNKEEIIEQILLKRGKVIDSPLLSDIYGLNHPAVNYEFSPEKAQNLLQEAGFVKNEQGIREKIIKKNPAFQFKKDLKQGSSGTDVKELQKCLSRDSEIYPGGIVNGNFGPSTKQAVIKFQEKYRQDVLTPYNLKSGTGEVLEGTRKKLNTVCFGEQEQTVRLAFTLTTVQLPQMAELARLLKKQWESLGIEIEIKTFDIGALEREIIKPRDYETLLFGEVFGIILDPFPFWHSSQKKDPGLNLALYENKNADSLLKEAREILDEDERKEKLEKFQEILLKDAPAVFLYSPDYLYLVSKKIKGVDAKIVSDPSKRFSGIENWYIETKRKWK